MNANFDRIANSLSLLYIFFILCLLRSFVYDSRFYSLFFVLLLIIIIFVLIIVSSSFSLFLSYFFCM